jgi:flavin-dependent dehydrogenase
LSKPSGLSKSQPHNRLARSYPVLVVGGGPAGLATAIALAEENIPALVVERSVYDDVRIGEHLQPAAVLQLRSVDSRSNLPLDVHFASAGIEAYWGAEAPNYMDYFFHPGQQGLNLSRPRFDADLARACELCGATVLRNASLIRARRGTRGWEIDIAVGRKTRKHSISIVVDATGRAATFSRHQGAKILADDRQIAVAALANDSHGSNYTRSLVETVEIGWWYHAPLGPTRSICMLVTDDDLLPRGARSDLKAWWLDQLGRTVHLVRRWRNAVPPERLMVRSARSQRIDPACGTGWIAVGDAAMAFDPLASQGIAKALHHGKLAAGATAAQLAGDISSLQRLALEFEREYAAYRATRAAYYRLEERWPGSAFWSRRHERGASAISL